MITEDEGDGGLYFNGERPQSVARRVLGIQEAIAGESLVESVVEKSIPSIAPAPGLNFFTDHEFRTAYELTECIIPTDSSSPGAKTAGVAAFLDRYLAIAQQDEQISWRLGLQSIDKTSQSLLGQAFIEIEVSHQEELLSRLAKAEMNPKSELEKFFVIAKRFTWDAYYRSAIGIHHELRYRGNSYNREFRGCQHPEHGF